MAFEEIGSRYDGPGLEENILKFWRVNDTFEQTLAQSAERPLFTFNDGPPTANGRPGIHHVLARAFKDAFPRYKTMRGYHVPRKAGWDTHGLPVEHEVEKRAEGRGSHRELRQGGLSKQRSGSPSLLEALPRVCHDAISPTGKR